MKVNLPSWNSNRFEVSPDIELLESLTRDMNACTTTFQKPADWWMLPENLIKGTMADLMAPWCGKVGQLPLSDLSQVANVSGSVELIPKYEKFLRAIDHLNLLSSVTLPDLAGRGWRVMDLGSLMDFLLISAFYNFSGSGPHRVFEIGGGFGRLPEFMQMSIPGSIKYTNVDAVPVSLMYSYQYLKHRFPEKNIQIFSGGDVANDIDFLIVPAWKLEELKATNYDIGVNIESMQEMNQELVDYYLNKLNAKIKIDGLIYLVNSREYKFKGNWSIPDNWQCMLRHRTPRSWTANHPAEVYLKRSVNYQAQNILRAAFFKVEISGG